MNKTNRYWQVLQLIPNFEMAQVGETGEPLPRTPFYIPAREYKPSKLVWKHCEHCGRGFHGAPRSRYHSKDCRNRANVKKNYDRRKVNPAKYANAAGVENDKWQDVYTRLEHGMLNPHIMPKICHRPNRRQKETLLEIRNDLKRRGKISTRYAEMRKLLAFVPDD